MPQHPLLNITMPVFNRLQTTQRTLLALHKYTRGYSVAITVVDNGSERELVQKLVEFRKAGIIDNLFLLPENMGVSCAANIGWDAVDAPYYMKFDNDMLMTGPDVLRRLFALWEYGDPVSTLGPSWDPQNFVGEDTICGPEGKLGICRTNLGGACLVVPKTVSDGLGQWSEDYGLYGAEDGDYGLRMNCAAYPQYYFDAREHVVDLGGGDHQETYVQRGLDKQEERKPLFYQKGQGIGLFQLNNFLYANCIRRWNVPRRYQVVGVNPDFTVQVEERPEYRHHHRGLMACKALVDKRLTTPGNNQVQDCDFIEELKVVAQKTGIA